MTIQKAKETISITGIKISLTNFRALKNSGKILRMTLKDLRRASYES